MSRWVSRLRYYGDVRLLARILFFSFRIAVCPNHRLLHLTEAKKSNQGNTKKVTDYVNLCLRIRKLLGFRDTCLRSSLLLCRFLRQAGDDARIVFAARKQDGRMSGHCWVVRGGVRACASAWDDELGQDGWKVLFSHPPAAAPEGSDVVTMDDHGGAYHIWKSRGMSNRILVHLDSHIDFNWIPQKDIPALLSSESLEELERLLEDPLPWDLSGKDREERVDCGNFVFQAMKEGIVRKFYWIVPDAGWDTQRYAKTLGIVLGIAPDKTEAYDISMEDNTVTARNGTREIVCCRARDIPAIDEEVLLDIDLDFVVTDGEPWIRPEELTELLRQKGIRPCLTTVAYSVADGFVPHRHKHLGDEIADLLRGDPR